MPRVTDEYRRARRNEIAHAALRVLERRGVASTSIAQIVAESGLSAGAIYASFTSKADLGRYVAGSLLDFEAAAFADRPETDPTPRTVVRRMIERLADGSVPVAVVVQFWGEAAVDPDLHHAVTETIHRLRDAFAEAIEPWSTARSGDEDPRALALRTADTMVTLCQGYIAHAALFGPTPVDQYLEGISALCP